MGYAEFFLAGVLAMTTFGIAMNTSWGIFMDKDSGIFYELLTYPITRRQFLVEKICFNVLLSAAGCLLAIILATWTMEVTVRWVWVPITLSSSWAPPLGGFFSSASWRSAWPAWISSIRLPARPISFSCF
jgi:ABC-type transport system involved in multi-copper enzyme maturation permease subunit